MRRDFSLSHLFAEAHDNIFGCGLVLVTFFVADHFRSAPEFTFLFNVRTVRIARSFQYMRGVAAFVLGAPTALSSKD